MKLRILLILSLGVLLIACGPTPEVEPQPSPTVAVPTETAVPNPTIEPTPTAYDTTAPTPEPSTAPEVEIDPLVLARQIIEQVDLTPPEGRRVEPCEGEAAVLCVNDGQENLGYAELLIFPLTGYAEDHPVRLVTDDLPADPTTYTADQAAAVQQALTALAKEHLDIIAADRIITYPNDTFTQLPLEPTRMGALSALTFGFVHTNEAGEVVERYLNVAAFDRQFIYWLGINYDPANVSTFVSDTLIIQFAPFFLEIAASLPIPDSSSAELPPLPPVVSYTYNSGDFPSSIRWDLTAQLPQIETAVPVLSQPAQAEPLTAEQAATLAQTFGFDNPLYVEQRSGLSTSETAALGLLVAFDGSRTLSFSGRPYSYSDVSNWNQGPDLPFDQAAPIAEQFLQENGWLTFPYGMAESDQGEGVLFLPIIDGVLLSSPAYGVRVAGNGRISGMSIYPLDDLAPTGSYSIMTAEMAWQQVQVDPNRPGTFYRIVPDAGETAVAANFPTEYSNIPAPGETGDFYTNIWAYRPLAGDASPIIQSSDFFRITGEADMLNELAKQTDFVVHLWGTVRESASGLLELELSRWEVVSDAGGVPMFFGIIQREGDQLFLADEANRTDYHLPHAPARLQEGDSAAVTGMPDVANGSDLLIWQKIAVYPPQPAIDPLPTAVPMQAIIIEDVKLVYHRLPAFAAGLPDDLFIPTWQFTGTADNGAQVEVWVTAVF